MASPSDSATHDWRATVPLIKTLFAQEQYRQCIQVCRQVLKASARTESQTPTLEKAFINFYLGLCHDEVARIMHHNSVAKMPSFDSAEHHYLEALTSLPSAEQTRMLSMRRIESACEDPFTDTPDQALRSPSVASDYFDRPNSRASSLNLSTPTRASSNAVAPSWQSYSSPAPTMSDMEDLESHHSYAELMTSNRITSFVESSPRHSQLQQSTSRFSLAEQTPNARNPSKHLSANWSGESQIHDPSRSSMIEQRPPAKALPRDVSRLSLIEQSPRSKAMHCEASRLSMLEMTPRPHSMHIPPSGATHPAKTGSPGRTFHIPPALRRESSRMKLRASLPKLLTRQQLGSPFGSSRFSQASYTNDCTSERSVSPISPVSPTSPAGSSVSPVSPIATDGSEGHDLVSTPVSTPVSPVQKKLHEPPTAELPKDILDEAMLCRLTTHLTRTRTQLERHVESVKRAKEQLRQTQLEKKRKRQALTNSQAAGSLSGKQNPSPSMPKSEGSSKQLQKVRSFWSFVPEDDKAVQKKLRIEEGRARKWAKPRFNATRYQDLCEMALDELAAA